MWKCRSLTGLTLPPPHYHMCVYERERCGERVQRTRSYDLCLVSRAEWGTFLVLPFWGQHFKHT